MVKGMKRSMEIQIEAIVWFSIKIVSPIRCVKSALFFGLLNFGEDIFVLDDVALDFCEIIVCFVGAHIMVDRISKRNIVSWSCLLDENVKNKRIQNPSIGEKMMCSERAHNLFDNMFDRNFVSLTCLFSQRWKKDDPKMFYAVAKTYVESYAIIVSSLKIYIYLNDGYEAHDGAKSATKRNAIVLSCAMKLIDIVNNQFDPGGFFAWHISFISGSTTYYCDDIVEDVKMVLHLFCEHVWESKANRGCASLEEGRVGASTSTEGQDFSVDVLPASHSSPASQESEECLKVTRKVSFFEPDRDSSVYVNSLIWELMKSSSSSLTESFKDTGHARVGKLHNSKYAPQLSEIRISGLKHIVNSNVSDEMKNQDCCNTGQRNSSCSIFSDDASLLTKNTCIVNADCLSEMAEIINSLSGPSSKSIMDIQALVTYLFSFHLLRAVEDTKAIGSLTSKSRLHVDCGANPLATDTGAHNESQHNPTDTHVLEGFTRQEHVFAGAFAGIFFSLCLHPVDTIKTITQSCRSDPNSIPDISRSIIYSRGVTGLYRIIASNIAASALIAAVYTFTSESVKGVLLPYFSKGCHSLAHCTAGGSASISTTSVIFTPSECIKQQIQVSSHYRSSWNALLGIVGKGGSEGRRLD